tara:strand:+ start:360 stop:800 length:441 start_codon:yes stop_codon:yes gene_type:complete
MKRKILIVKATYYKEISNDLLNGVINYLKKFEENNSNNIDFEIKTIDAPGCFEIPFVINNNKNAYDAFIALGCVIRGETFHFELICNAVTNKIMDLSILNNKPIGFGILTCEDIKQAKIRSDITKKNKGAEAAKACVDMLLQQIHG